MYRVLLVDDEEDILKGLKVIIDWDKLGCQVIQSCTDGVEGYEAAVSLMPDIIITDIRMPYLDGLQMIERIKQKGIHAKFIILSGYSEFEYAKKGIELGVNSYIIKPVNETEIEDCIKKSIIELEEQKKLEERMVNIRNKVLNDLSCFYTEDDEEVWDIIGKHDITLYNTNFACCIIQIEITACKHMAHEQTVRQAVRSIEGVVLPRNEGITFICENLNIGVIINKDTRMETPGLQKIVSEIYDTLKRTIPAAVTMGVSSIHDNITSIGPLFGQAREALAFKLFDGDNKIIYYDKNKDSPKNHKVPSALIEELRKAIQHSDKPLTRGVIRKMFDVLLNSGCISPDDYKKQCLYIIIDMFRDISEIDAQLKEQLGTDILSLPAMHHFRTANQIENWLTNTIYSIIENNIGKRSAARSGNIDIEAVKSYLDANYMKNITLSEVSDIFYMNQFYLSQLFKIKTGLTFSQYIKVKKIEKCKLLLSTTNLMVSEIAEKLGYTDYKYFSKQFYKVVGCTPTEYRKQI